MYHNRAAIVIQCHYNRAAKQQSDDPQKAQKARQQQRREAKGRQSMLGFTLKWYGENKFYVLILLVVLSGIAYVCFILAQALYHFTMWDTISSGYRNAYFFTASERIPLAGFRDGFLDDLSDKVCPPERVYVSYGEGEYNANLYSAALTQPEEGVTWGKFPESDNEVLQFIESGISGDLELFGEGFKVSGFGAITSWGSDYTLTQSGFDKYVGVVSGSQLVFAKKLTGNQLILLRTIIKEHFSVDYALDSYTGFNENAFRSVRNMLTLFLMLIVAAVIAMAYFIEIMLRLQTADIFVWFLCGASKGKIALCYSISAMLFVGLSLLLGLAAFGVTLKLDVYNYSEMNQTNNILIASAFCMAVMGSMSAITTRKVVNDIVGDYKEALS
jgi:hypothetical protein